MNKKEKKIRLNSYSKLDALVQIAEFMYQTETKMTDISISNLKSDNNEGFCIDFMKEIERGSGVSDASGLFEKLCSPREDEIRFSIRSFNSSNDINNENNRSIFV